MQHRPGLYIVIHINAFTHQLDGGYLALRTEEDNLKKIGDSLDPSAVLKELAANPDMQISVLYV